MTPRAYVWSLLEPPGHAPAEPHTFDACPNGACPREEPAYLFSGEFHETVVDLRIKSCVGPDLVWARRYRSRTGPNTVQGNGWDFSYNVYLETIPTLSSGPIIVHDGNARPAIFYDDGNGTYSAPMYHRTGAFETNGDFIMTFADGGTWTFDASNAKLGRITDRNGNTIELDYDTSDRLVKVTDAVGREIDVAYDGSGRIETVTDFTNRVVAYEYYGTSDPDGNPGDLKRVTYPAITGTVTGNDFSSGTTTTYTYSTGLSPAALNGNLLTIEDSLSQVYLQNTYASTTNPADLEYDRLVEQVWGEPDDRIGISYAAVTPSSGNNFAVVKAWVNDRVGRVSEHYFDADNLEVIKREHTGFADPDLPTTDASNLPMGKLRPSDPGHFETRYLYNDDAHLVVLVHPRQNLTGFVYESALDPQADPRFRGNLRTVIREAGNADNCVEADTTRSYEYEPGFGNEHGELNFVTKATDERGHITQATYDSAGNRTATIHPEPDTREDMEYNGVGQITRHVYPEDQHEARRETTYTYQTTGARCLADTIEDPTGLALTTTREYDALARETRRIDPRGNDKLYTYNAHDELIREEDVLHGGERAKTDSIYNANMWLVQVDYEALDCEGMPMSHAIVSTFHEYDILGEDTITRMEVGPSVEIAHEVQLDANRNPVLVLQGEAVNNNDPNNTVTTVYDERGLVYRESRAAGTSLASTTQHDYDENGNEVLVRVGLEGPERQTHHTYDCQDRRIETVDPMGNRTELDLDEAGNVEEQRFYGELVDVPGDASNVLLERATHIYDTMNRVSETTRDHFDPATQTPLGTGVSVTKMTYDGESRVILRENANGYFTAHDFDGAGRLLQTVDAEGNIVDLEYDANGNITQRTVTDRSSIDGSTQVGVWTKVYDARNNLVEITDPMSQTKTTCWDSLGRMLEEVDARGNRTLHDYDGLGRLLETTHELTDDGTGSGTFIGTAVTVQTWDDTNRLVAREDPGGNVTVYEYDALDRVTKEIFADATERTYTYDIHDSIVEEEDPNGTLLKTTYDGLARAVSVTVTSGTGVGGGTTFEAFAYDGRSLVVSATDDDSNVTRTWDSLGALLTETQEYSPPLTLLSFTPRTVTYERDAVGNPTKTIYPSGRTINRTFDGLGRTSTIRIGTRLVAELEYLGPNLLRKTFPVPDTQSDYTYDLAGRMLTSHHAEIGGVTIDSRAYAWDPTNNKIEDEDLASGTLTGTRTADHDSLGRMVDSDVNGSSSTDRTVAYTFDGAGNRTNVTGDTCPGTYARAGTDALVNQYTETPCEEWDHDLTGNVVETSASSSTGRDILLVYDHRNRLVSVDAASAVLFFAYDALGRKLYTRRNDGSTNVEDVHVFDDWNVIEEYRDGGSTPLRKYIYGDGLDERLEMTTNRTYWFFEDELGSAVAAVRRPQPTASLNIERYAYLDYGEPRFFWNGTPRTSSTASNPYLFAGARWLPDLAFYDMRTRHLDTLTGRFTSRDSIGIWGDEDNLGNGYTYVGNSPATHGDPTGETKKPKFDDNCKNGSRLGGRSEQTQVEDALEWSWKYASAFNVWMHKQAGRKRKNRRNSWNDRNIGRRWFGKYNGTRFQRIKRFADRIHRRIANNRIRFRCGTFGKCGESNTRRARTYPLNWHARILLCRRMTDGPSDQDKFFGTRSPMYRHAVPHSYKSQASTIVHEVSHNIAAIHDHAYLEPFNTETVRNLPNRKATYNAASYQGCSAECFGGGC